MAGEILDSINLGVKILAKILVYRSSRDLGSLLIAFKYILSRRLVVLQRCRYRQQDTDDAMKHGYNEYDRD